MNTFSNSFLSFGRKLALGRCECGHVDYAFEFGYESSGNESDDSIDSIEINGCQKCGSCKITYFRSYHEPAFFNDASNGIPKKERNFILPEENFVEPIPRAFLLQV